MVDGLNSDKASHEKDLRNKQNNKRLLDKNLLRKRHKDNISESSIRRNKL
jgi:hypothetical protein